MKKQRVQEGIRRVLKKKLRNLTWEASVAAQFSTMDEYIRTFSPEIQAILKKIRQVIHEALPDAEETISYQIPTFRRKGRSFISFAAYKKHIGAYPVPAGNEAYRKKIASYIKGKGTLQFPLDQAIPYELIEETAKFLAKEKTR